MIGVPGLAAPAAPRPPACRLAPAVVVRDRPLYSLPFSWGVYAEQLLYNTVFPLSIPLIFCLRGPKAVINFRVTPTSSCANNIAFAILLVSNTLWACVGGGCAISLFAPLCSDGSAQCTSLNQMVIFETILTALTIVYQRVGIATKYATLSEAQYRGYIDTLVDPQVMMDEQLLTGWASLSDVQLEREMAAAMADVVGLEPRTVKFVLSTGQLEGLVRMLVRPTPPSVEDLNREAEREGARAAVERKAGGGVLSVGGQTAAAAGLFSRSAAEAAVAEFMDVSITNPLMAAPLEERERRRSAFSAALAKEEQAAKTGPKVRLLKLDPLEKLDGEPSSPSSTSAAASAKDHPAGRAATTMPFPSPSDGDGDGDDAPLRVDGELLPDASVSVSAQWLAKMIFKRIVFYDTGLNMCMRMTNNVLALLVAFTPPVVRALFGLPVFGSTPLMKLLFASAVILQWFVCSAFLGYLRVAVLDYARRASSLQLLNSLCSAPFFAYSGSGSPQRRRFETTVIPLGSPTNALAFLFVRRLILGLGIRFYWRVQIFQSQSVLFIVAVFVALLSVVFTPAFFNAQGSFPALLSLCVVGCAYAIYLASYIILALFFAIRVNHSAKVAVAILSAKRLELEYARAAASATIEPSLAAELDSAATTILCVRECIDHDAVLSPFRLLGAQATWGLLTSSSGVIAALSTLFISYIVAPLKTAAQASQA